MNISVITAEYLDIASEDLDISTEDIFYYLKI